ncbi:hypothetical protein [Pseudomonas sp. C9-3]|uniref:hypothetical protein n=1 Tax=Pseudomonas sp. C9-3 TaxID=3078264 RepID=UPI0028EFF614|nr:hypothetical protein [Pseudomonas sp. C9-3]
MANWENTTYIHQASVEQVVATLNTIFAKEKMKRVPSPPQRSLQRVEPMQYDIALENDLWGLAVFPGVDGWTIVKTAPLELLAESAPSTNSSRLTAVAKALGAYAFQVNVYDGLSVLYEVSPSGEQAFSGFSGEEEWHGFSSTEDNYVPHFQLHDMGHLINPEMSAEQLELAISGELSGINAQFCDNMVSVDTLISHKPFRAFGGLAIYYQWTGASRQRRVPSETYDQWN